MLPAKQTARTPLRERHLPRKPAAVAGHILGVRPWILAIAALTLLAFVWVIYGWLTNPVVPLPHG